MNRLQWKLVQDCVDNEEKLTSWEHDFINDLDDRGEDYELSDKQNHALTKIAVRVTL